MQMPLRPRFFHATVAALAILTLAWPVYGQEQHVGRESDITTLRLGQRIQVDDGTCPAGQVKEVSGSKMVANGVMMSRTCVPRVGTKKTRN